MRKPFDPKLYRENDRRAKEALSSYLSKIGFRVTIRHEDTRADLLTNDGIFHEPEVKRGWIDLWPSRWEWLQIPERKERLIQIHERVKFWVLNDSLRQARTVEDWSLRSQYKKEVRNNLVENEKFFCIPLAQCRLVDLTREVRLTHYAQFLLDAALKQIAGFYVKGTCGYLREHQRGLWIQIIDLEEKINQAILKNEGTDKIDQLLQEYVKKWKAGHARQRSFFDEKKG